VSTLKAAKPYQAFSVVCYHIVSTGKGRTSRSVSHRNRKELVFNNWEDYSPEATSLNHLKDYSVSKVYFTKNIMYTEELKKTIDVQWK